MTCTNQTTTRLSSPSLSPLAPSAEPEGTQTHCHTHRERCGVPSSIHPPPNHGGQPEPKGHTQPTAGTLPRRVRGVRIVPKPIIELVRKHPHLNLDEFRSGAGFFVPAKRSRRRAVPVRSRALRERRGVTLFIHFAPPNLGGQPQGHLQPTVGNLPRRRKVVVAPQVQLARDTPTILDETKGRGFFVSEELKPVV